MTKEEILHLAGLARITLSDEELQNFETELPQILEYVSAVTSIAGDDVDKEPEVGALYNVFRTDEVTIEPGSHTDALLREMPDTKDGFLKVKKILNTDE